MSQIMLKQCWIAGIALFLISCAPQTSVNSSQENESLWLEAEYDAVFGFAPDRNYGILVKDGKNILVDNEYNLFFSTPEYEIVNLYEDVMCVQDLQTSRYGLRNLEGEPVVSPQYEEPIEFSEGLACVQRDGKIGYIDTKGNVIIDFSYAWGMPFQDGLAAVGYTEEEFYFIDSKGEIKSGPYEYLGDTTFTYVAAYMEYSEGYTAFFEQNEDSPGSIYAGTGYWGYLDKNGDIAIPAQYLSVRPFHEGMANVLTATGDSIFINPQGEVVLHTDSIGDFYRGLVLNGDMFMNQRGEQMIEIPEGYIVPATQLHGSGNFYVGDYMVVSQEETRNDAVMDKQGTIIFQAEPGQEIEIFSDQYAAVKTKDKWTIVPFSSNHSQ